VTAPNLNEEFTLKGFTIKQTLQGELMRINCRFTQKNVCGIKYVGLKEFFSYHSREIDPSLRFLVGRVVPTVVCGSVLTVVLTALVATEILDINKGSGVFALVASAVLFPLVMAVLFEIPGCCCPSNYIYERSLVKRFELRKSIIEQFIQTLDDNAPVDPVRFAELIASIKWEPGTEYSLIAKASIDELEVMKKTFQRLGFSDAKLPPSISIKIQATNIKEDPDYTEMSLNV
jgi:hypothetical protein